MAVPDDLNRLAAQDVVYLTRRFSGQAGNSGLPIASSTEVFKGRLRQALNGDWVFNAFTGQNGVVGFVLGTVGSVNPLWNSSESPASGLQVTITTAFSSVVGGVGNVIPVLTEVIVVTTLIPIDFTD